MKHEINTVESLKEFLLANWSTLDLESFRLIVSHVYNSIALSMPATAEVAIKEIDRLEELRKVQGILPILLFNHTI